MKILTKEEEQEHYNATVKGGVLGGAAGLALGGLGVFAASRRYPAFRGLTLPFRAFLITGSGTFAAIVAADSNSRNFENARNPERQFRDESQNLQAELSSQKPLSQRALTWAADNRYSLVFGSWVASMGGALAFVGRNPYLTGQQKLVQARVYAQGLTMAVVIASLAFEGVDSAQGKGRWETVRYLDPEDPEHKRVVEKQVHHERYAGEDQWRDMVAAEEERIKEREEAVAKREEQKGHKEKAKRHTLEKAEHGKPEESKDSKLNAP
ncbi:hypothetical protein WHR41_08554 [Cladosporium halotolerans]|uniref:HIG1 domain-containing protein n=1 Tax=Cladosporium halotolerans TaxID=1052096 RepID=A0AB34KF94_9PEZI